MIKTSMQLKALVRNMSKSNSEKAQALLRHYAMERFLERLSVSNYKDNLILKGGTLISSIIGLNSRTTLDVDTTLKGQSLTEDNVRSIVDDIININLDDGMSFKVKKVETIMDESDYPGIRVKLKSFLDKMNTPFKIDFSAGDVITPREISYSYKLLFEERSISVLAYNIETILAEKLESVISRGILNSRMRDYYDLFIFETTLTPNIDFILLKEALTNTSNHRGTLSKINDMELILTEIKNDSDMKNHWSDYQKRFEYAININFADTVQAIERLFDKLDWIESGGESL